MMEEAMDVTDDTFDVEVLQSPVPVMVDFWATWCGPCRMVSPIVEELAKEYAGRLRVRKVDVDRQQGSAAKYDVRSIPTLLFFKAGRVVDQIVGAVPKKTIVEKIQGIAGA